MDSRIIQLNNVNFYYGESRALTDISMTFVKNKVTALIGPSGCGKSTLLRLLNRMNDLIDGTKVEGEILFESKNIYAPDVDPVEIRRKIGMVFQKPNPFP
jgi:phosphate transport system ATP-binding protein